MKKKKEQEEFKFSDALDLLEAQGIDREYIYEAMVLALTSAYKKNSSLSNVRVEVDKDNGKFRLFSFKTVVLDEKHKESLEEDEIPMKDEEILTEEQLEDEELEDLPEEFRYRPFVFNESKLLHLILDVLQQLLLNK